MNKFILKILFVLLFAIVISAQTNDRQPILIDEFGATGSEDVAVRLDNFISELSNASDKKGIVRINRNNKDCFLCHYREGSWIDAYLKNTRKTSVEKYGIEFCDDVGLRIELYLLPPAATLPNCMETVEIPNKTSMFDSAVFYFDGNKVNPLEETIIDVVGAPDGEYSGKALRKVKNLLDTSAESKIYIVAYLGTNFENGYYDKKKGYIEKEIRNPDRKNLAEKLIRNAKNEFIKNGINPAQIESIEGGYVEGKRRLKFYFVPKNGELPKPKPDYFPKNSKGKKQ